MLKNSFYIKKLSQLLSLQLFTKVLSIVSGIIIVRLITPAEYGQYIYVISIVSLITGFASAGMGQLLIKEVSQLEVSLDWAKLKGLIIWSYWRMLLLSIIGMGVLGCAILYGLFELDTATLLLVALITVPFVGFNGNYTAISNGLRHYIKSQTPSIIGVVIFPLVLVVYFFNKNLTLDAKTMIVIQLCITVIVFMMSTKFLLNILDNRIKKALPIKNEENWNMMILPFTGLALIGVANAELATVALGRLSSLESVAIFKIASQGVLLITMLLSAANGIAAPNISRNFKEGDMEAVQDMLTKSVLFTSAVAIPMTVLLMLFGEEILTLVFGLEYAKAAFPLRILLVGQLINILCGSVGLVLNMSGHVKVSFRVLSYSLTINIFLMYYLVPIYHEIGAAISVSASVILWNAILLYKVVRLTGLTPYFNLKIFSK